MCLAPLSPIYAQNATPLAASAQPVPAASQLIIYHAGSLTAAFKSIATAFLEFLLTPDKGAALQKVTGPDPILPAIVSEEDYSRLPAELRPPVTTKPMP
jgi:hypothetical protein